MKKLSKKTLLGAAVLLMTACLMIGLLTGCSGKKQASQPQPETATKAAVTANADTQAQPQVQTQAVNNVAPQNNSGNIYAMLKPYDDFGCASGNQMQYKLDVDDGRVKIESYYYTAGDDHDNDFYLDLSTAQLNGNSVTFTRITNENGQDVSGQFNGITMTTNGNALTLKIDRKDGGGGAGDLTGGTYNLTPINSDAYDHDHHDDHDDHDD